MLKVYTTSSCAFCPMVKKFLAMKNVPYTEVNVTDDNKTRSELFEATGMMSVPVTTNGKEFVVGWNPSKLAELCKNTAVAV